MPMFNTSNPFRSSNSSSSSTQSSARRGPPRKTQPSSSSSSSSSSKQQPARPPPDPRLVSLSQLESATTRLSDLRKSFQIPPHLDFNPSTSTNSVPKLAYTPNNAPFHAYDEALTKLLIELDGIDSCGGEMDIRTRRKGLVLEVERELERLEQIKKEKWERHSYPATAKAERVEEPEKMVRGAKENSNTQNGSTSVGAPPLPPGIPLPPRDYPQEKTAPSSNPWHTASRDTASQTHSAQSPSAAARRPSSHSEPQVARPPPAYRRPAPVPPSTTGWNMHEQPQFGRF